MKVGWTLTQRVDPSNYRWVNLRAAPEGELQNLGFFPT